jgi:hypothetical protein
VSEDGTAWRWQRWPSSARDLYRFLTAAGNGAAVGTPYIFLTDTNTVYDVNTRMGEKMNSPLEIA